MRTYIGLVRDHSGSMRSLATQACNDYNLTLSGIQESMRDEGQEAFVTVVECGVGYQASVRVANSLTDVNSLREMTSYSANGSATPLWDSVGEVIDQIEHNIPAWAVNDTQVAFLVMVTTDGEENSSKRWNARSIAERIRKLQATDRWTFVFRVPRGAKRTLVVAGIPDGNVIEWEQTSKSLEYATQAQVAATKSYFAARSAGATKSTTFYANVAAIKPEDVKVNLVDLSKEFSNSTVPAHQDGVDVKTFCLANFGDFKIGRAYYQLTKRETVQAGKSIAIQDRLSGQIYTGNAARQLLGFPFGVEIKVAPGTQGQYDVFVQSTSYNRKLVKDTRVLYHR